MNAICAIRSINKVSVYDLSKERSQQFIEEMQTAYPEIEFSSGETLAETVEQAEIICTLTPSKEAFLKKNGLLLVRISMLLVRLHQIHVKSLVS